MKEKTLLSIAVICMLIGLTTVYIFSIDKLNYISIDKIDGTNIGKNIKIQGQIIGMMQSDKVTRLKISQPSNIDVILFGKLTDNVNKGDIVDVYGKIEEIEVDTSDENSIDKSNAENKYQIIGDVVRVRSLN